MNGNVNVILSGCLNGLLCTGILQPFDVIRTKMVKNPKLTMSSLIKDTPVKRLWAGTKISIIRSVIGSGIHYGCLSRILTKDSSGNVTKDSAIISGIVSRTFGIIALSPLTVLKTQREYSNSGKFSLTPKTLYSGILPTIARDIPYASCNVLLYTQIRDALKDIYHPTVLPMFCGMLSGTFTTAITHPMDVIRIHMQLDKGNNNVIKIMRNIHSKNGIYAFFAGVLPRLFKRGISNAISWSIFENLG